MPTVAVEPTVAVAVGRRRDRGRGRRHERTRPRGEPAVGRGEAAGPAPAGPEMTRERARSERRDLDKERGEPVAGPRGKHRSLKRVGRPLGSWTTRPRILVTNDDGIESRGLLALKLALDPIGDVTVVAPDLNQSAVGHTEDADAARCGSGSGPSPTARPATRSTAPPPTASRSRSWASSRSASTSSRPASTTAPTWATTSRTPGTVSAAMEAVINNCPAFAISQEYEEHIDFALAAMAAAVVARNILEHGLRRGELLVGQRAGRRPSRTARGSRSRASAGGSTRTS